MTETKKPKAEVNEYLAMPLDKLVEIQKTKQAELSRLEAAIKRKIKEVMASTGIDAKQLETKTRRSKKDEAAPE